MYTIYIQKTNCASADMAKVAHHSCISRNGNYYVQQSRFLNIYIYIHIYIYRSEGLSLRDMLSDGTWTLWENYSVFVVVATKGSVFCW